MHNESEKEICKERTPGRNKHRTKERKNGSVISGSHGCEYEGDILMTDGIRAITNHLCKVGLLPRDYRRRPRSDL
jgi:hypothetical protein